MKGKRIAGTPEQRFWAKVDKTGDCWLWQGAIGKHGYGTFTVKRPDGGTRFWRAHRFAYELLVGPIPEGMFLDHLCRNTACVNPAHLEPVDARENTRRGLRGALPTHCVNGHRWTPENTYIQKTGNRVGRRWCRQCAIDRQAARRERTRAGVQS